MSRAAQGGVDVTSMMVVPVVQAVQVGATAISIGQEADQSGLGYKMITVPEEHSINISVPPCAQIFNNFFFLEFNLPVQLKLKLMELSGSFTFWSIGNYIYTDLQ